MNNVTLNTLKHCFLYCTMNEFTAIMKKKLSASGIKSADFGIRIAEKKLMTPPPIDCPEKWMTPLYAFIKNRWPPLYSASPHPLRWNLWTVPIVGKQTDACVKRQVIVPSTISDDQNRLGRFWCDYYKRLPGVTLSVWITPGVILSRGACKSRGGDSW